mmetsp:Transcript_14773/g.27992  ORF Transcript_14773/g.27992 Transcript_14773/m.27992 type:complete len:552 (-) Transcript_14773:60-1715(-)
MQVLGAEQRGVYSEVLQHHHLPQQPNELLEQPTDVLLKVAYTDLNPVDLQKLAKGPPIQESVFVPGYGGTGIVEQVGSAVPNKAWVGKPVCFLGDPSRKYGSWASHVAVDYRCVALLPTSSPHDLLRDAAAVPVAGLTAYECLVKMGLAGDTRVGSDGQLERVGLSADGDNLSIQAATTKCGAKSFLIVGAAGGVGSWLLTLTKALHPNMKMIATASSAETEEWCKSLGANQMIKHHEISQVLKGGREGSVDYIVCLTEPTSSVFGALAEVIKPYGKIVLVAAGKGIESLDLGFCFFKCVNIYTETVFSSIRTKFEHIVPADELTSILNLMARQTIVAPLSPDMESVSEKFSDALKDNGVLPLLSRESKKRGNLVMMVHAGDGLIFLDFKTASVFSVPRKECITKKILNQVTKENSPSEWKEQAPIIERQALIKKMTTHPKLGIAKVAEKQAKDYQDGLELQEAENVKSMWGVQLKKREKNAKGEELLFVDLRTSAIGELSRKKCIELRGMTIGKSETDGTEIVEEAVAVLEERDDLLAAVRQALKIHLEG